MSNLVEISEEDALSNLKSARVTSVEQFPSDTIGASIVRYSNGLVWMKYRRANSTTFVNVWYTDRPSYNSVPAKSDQLTLTAKGEPFQLRPVTSGNISFAENLDEEPDDQLDIPPELVSVPETPPDYLVIKEIVAEKGFNDPAFQLALQDVSFEDIQRGILPVSVYEAAKLKLETTNSGATTKPPSRGRKASSGGKK